MKTMHYIGLDVHKKAIAYCIKEASNITLSQSDRARVGQDEKQDIRASYGSRRNL